VHAPLILTILCESKNPEPKRVFMERNQERLIFRSRFAAAPVLRTRIARALEDSKIKKIIANT